MSTKLPHRTKNYFTLLFKHHKHSIILDVVLLLIRGFILLHVFLIVIHPYAHIIWAPFHCEELLQFLLLLYVLESKPGKFHYCPQNHPKVLCKEALTTGERHCKPTPKPLGLWAGKSSLPFHWRNSLDIWCFELIFQCLVFICFH